MIIFLQFSTLISPQLLSTCQISPERLTVAAVMLEQSFIPKNIIAADFIFKPIPESERDTVAGGGGGRRGRGVDRGECGGGVGGVKTEQRERRGEGERWCGRRGVGGWCQKIGGKGRGEGVGKGERKRDGVVVADGGLVPEFFFIALTTHQ